MNRTNNKYSISFFYNNKRVMFMEFTHHPDDAINWVDSKRIYWNVAKVYDRKSRELLKVIEKP